MKHTVSFKKIVFSFMLTFLIAGTLCTYARDFYWEVPSRITKSDTRFPSAVSNTSVSAVFWQEIDTSEKHIWISGQFYDGNGEWRTVEKFAGPFSYSGDIPDIYSAASLENGITAVAVLSDVRTISVYVTSDAGRSFSHSNLPRQDTPIVAPRIYASSAASFMLFTSRGENEAFSMLYSTSPDGISWPSFHEFKPASGYTNPFIPVVAAVPGGDIVVFQAQYNSGTRLSYQLFSTKTSDGGNSWSAPVLITGDISAAGTGQPFSSYNNQRPSLYVFDNKVFIAWERTYYASENARIWAASLDLDGKLLGDVQQISDNGNANRPVLFEYDNTLSLVWFDTRNGAENVFLAQKNGYLWDQQQLSSGRNSSVFAFPAITEGGKDLSFIWQTNPASGGSVPYISMLSPDRTARMPKIECLTFTDGRRGTGQKQRVKVDLPYDSSGIAGFSWVWTQEKDELPPEQFMNLPSQTQLTVTADKDDIWYLRVRAVDYAGNWSKPAEVTYFRDTTPPGIPLIDPLNLDTAGFAPDNNLVMSWKHDDADIDIAGYTWSLEYVDSVEKRLTGYPRHPRRAGDAEAASAVAALLERNKDAAVKVTPPPARILGREEAASFENKRNGVYVFSVAAVDTVGNIGPSAKMTVILNKYIPYTFITSAERKTDMFGNMAVNLYGGGYTYDGTISKIYIDSDGQAPYDLTLTADNNQFKVVSDSSITGIHIDSTVKEGKYRIGLVHTDRGLYFSGTVLSILQNGTVKIENEYSFVPEWKPAVQTVRWHIQAGDILLWIIMVLALTGMIFGIRGLADTARDAVYVRYEVRALLTGDVMPMEKKKKTAVLKRRGVSLKIKLMSFTIFIVFAIVFLVAMPLQYIMVHTQEQTLAEGLQNRIDVLTDSLSSGVRAYLPMRNVLELSYLPQQSSALNEAEYATITGLNTAANNTNLDYVWASNDTEIASKVDTGSVIYGESRVKGEDIQKITELCSALNTDAAAKVNEMTGNIAELNAEGAKLSLRTDPDSVKRRSEIEQVTQQLNARVTEAFNQIAANGAGSYPSFDSRKFDRSNTEYLFYKPVLYRQGNDQNYVRGIVFIKASTRSLIQALDDARKTIIKTTLVIGLVAALIGAVGALILATIIVQPIRKLAAHVVMIGQTKDKEKLAGKDIVIKSHDEIGQLGENVNEMTHGLIHAAQEEHLLMDGKVVQQTFLPLLTGKTGSKETTAVLKEKTVECFGYYEGASGVSGDYFDYKKLDDRWYVIIKCDVSGHGVPAALIMTVVATLFRKYFENWTYQSKGTRINEAVVQINDFIESLGLKGKFATIILCLFDSQTGTLFMCNAGDNIVHYYDNTEHGEKTLTLQETPAAGPLPSFMVDMKGGFKVEKIVLKHNDVLFLYTDGIEEATRKFRDSSFEVMKCAEPGLKEGDAHGNHKVGQESEQMEPERVQAIIEAVFSHTKYRLEKYHNPIAGEVLEFDFTTCTGTIEESILALISVEKVFRMYKDPFVAVTDTVRVDRKIDAFLKTHFNRYDFYCSNKIDNPDDPSYLYYSFLKEDDQLDDLTLVAVKRL